MNPPCFIPSPKSTSPKEKSNSTTVLTAPGKAGAGKTKRKELCTLQISNKTTHFHLVLCRAAESPWPVPKAAYWYRNFSASPTPPAGLTSPPFFTSCLTSMFHPQQTQQKIRNASDKPRKQPKGGFFIPKTRCKGSSLGTRAGKCSSCSLKPDTATARRSEQKLLLSFRKSHHAAQPRCQNPVHSADSYIRLYYLDA